MKKSISILILMVLIIVTITVVPVNAVTDGATIRLNNTIVRPGGTFSVTLHVECNDEINGVIGTEENDGFKLNYDTSKLELVSRAPNILMDANDGGDTILLAHFNESQQTQTAADVYTWNFKVKENASLGSIQLSTTAIKIMSCTESIINVNPQTVTLQIDQFSSSKYLIDDSNLKIKNIDPNTTVSVFKQNIVINSSYTIKDKDSTTLSNTSRVGTKGTIATIFGTYKMVVKGDVTGDGLANMTDILALNSHRLKRNLLTEEFLLAGDVNNDNQATILDIFRLNSFRLGKIPSL